MMPYLLFAVFIWLILHNMQKLLSRWRVKRSDNPEAEIVVDKSSGWNLFVGHFFGLLKLVVLLASGLFVLLITQWGDGL